MDVQFCVTDGNPKLNHGISSALFGSDQEPVWIQGFFLFEEIGAKKYPSSFSLKGFKKMGLFKAKVRGWAPTLTRLNRDCQSNLETRHTKTHTTTTRTHTHPTRAMVPGGKSWVEQSSNPRQAAPTTRSETTRATARSP